MERLDGAFMSRHGELESSLSVKAMDKRMHCFSTFIMHYSGNGANLEGVEIFGEIADAANERPTACRSLSLIELMQRYSS